MARMKLVALVIIFLAACPVFAEVSIHIGDKNAPEKRDDVGDLHFARGKNVRVASDETIEGDLYAAGERLNMRGQVTGDVFTFVMEAVVDGSVGGNLAVFAAEAEINGQVDGSVRAFVSRMVVTGQIEKNLMVFGAQVDSRPSSVVRGTLLARVGQADLEGTYHGYVEISGGEAVLAGHFLGDVEASCDTLRINPGTIIEGNLTYTSRNDLEIPDGVVAGLIKRVEREAEDEVATETSSWRMPTTLGLLWEFYLALTALIAGALMVLFFRPFIVGSLELSCCTRSAVAMALGTGLIALLVMLFFGVLCVWLIPLSIFLWAALLTLVYFGGLIGKIILGRLLLQPLLKQPAHPLLALLVGVAMVMLVGLIPYLGAVFWMLVTVTGVGAALLQIRAVRPGSPESVSVEPSAVEGMPVS